MSDPVVLAILPASGPAGTLVTISGSGLAEVSQVAFGGTLTPILSQSDSAIMATVPAAPTGAEPITLVAAGTVLISGGFAVTTATGPAPPSPNYAPILIGGLVIAGATLVLAMREHTERDAERAARRR